MSSHDYYVQMQQLHKEILDKEKEKEIYDTVLLQVQKLSLQVPFFKRDLESAKTFLESGFSEDGKIYGNGKLEMCISNIDSARSSLQEAITKISSKTRTLQASINHLQGKYNNAKTNYGIALNRERELAKQQNKNN